MPSFIETMADLKTTLEDDSALAAFTQAKWNKALTVTVAFRKRIEIKQAELPLAIITRPRVKKNVGNNSVKDSEQSVYVYFLFHQTDREKAAFELIEAEELVDDALAVDWTRDETAIDTTPVESVNDEGTNHPVYCFLGEYNIYHRR